jgi:hypothetical protein
MDHFFEEAAEGRIPLQAAPTDPAVVKELEAFTEKYGCEFAQFPPGPSGPGRCPYSPECVEQEFSEGAGRAEESSPFMGKGR